KTAAAVDLHAIPEEHIGYRILEWRKANGQRITGDEATAGNPVDRGGRIDREDVTNLRTAACVARLDIIRPGIRDGDALSGLPVRPYVGHAGFGIRDGKDIVCVTASRAGGEDDHGRIGHREDLDDRDRAVG